MKRKTDKLTALILACAMLMCTVAYAEDEGQDSEIIFDFNPAAQESVSVQDDSLTEIYEETEDVGYLPEDEILTPEPAEEEDEELNEEASEEADETEEFDDEITEDSEDEASEEPDEASGEEVTAKPKLRVWITSSLDGFETVQSGTEITLTAHLEGFDDISYKLQWQCSLDGENWRDEPGANELTFSFILTEENDDYLWRIIVILT